VTTGKSRRLNYTGRRTIRREDVTIWLTGGGAEEPAFDASLSRGRFQFPADARVFVEAYRQTSWQRFDFGTARDLRPPADRCLRAFGSGDGVRFRVKVVATADPDAGGRPARILGHADRIQPRIAEQVETRSLLDVVPGDFRDEVWRLEFDETCPPVLKVSRYLVPDWRSLAGTREFVTLALPEIFRSILKQIVLVQEHIDLEDQSDWRTQWLGLAVRLPGVSGTPPHPDEGDPESWIDDAVGAFCRQARIAERFREWWKRED